MKLQHDSRTYYATCIDVEIDEPSRACLRVEVSDGDHENLHNVDLFLPWEIVSTDHPRGEAVLVGSPACIVGAGDLPAGLMQTIARRFQSRVYEAVRHRMGVSLG